MGCIFQRSGSCNWYDTFDICLLMVKGPYRLGESFLDWYGMVRLVPSSHTLVPVSYFGASAPLIIWSCAFCSSCCAWSQSWIILLILSSVLGSWVVRLGWWMVGVYLRINSYGVFFVVLDGQEFLVYWAMGSHAAQLFCSLWQYILRYCSSAWFVLSLCPSVWGWKAVLMFC